MYHIKISEKVGMCRPAFLHVDSLVDLAIVHFVVLKNYCFSAIVAIYLMMYKELKQFYQLNAEYIYICLSYLTKYSNY